MSSSYVRTQIKNFIAAEAPTEKVIDLTSDYQEMKELLEDYGVPPDSPWLGVQFLGADEIPVALAADNTQGTYRETGGIYFHFVEIARLGNGDVLLTRGEALRNIMRGQRIGEIVIESVTPMNFDAGATLQFEAGFMSGSFICSYQRTFSI